MKSMQYFKNSCVYICAFARVYVCLFTREYAAFALELGVTLLYFALKVPKNNKPEKNKNDKNLKWEFHAKIEFWK